MTYNQIHTYFLNGGLVTLTKLSPMYAPFSLGYDTNSSCDYHMGTLWHTIDKCKALKNKVQVSIDCKDMIFRPSGPNVKNNPMLTHAGLLVDVI